MLILSLLKVKDLTNLFMDIAYPFVPKSNARLRPGHFWPIKLSNSKYACGIVLDVPKEKGLYTTRMFYAGLLDWIGDSKPTANSLESSPLTILRQGHAHIKTILFCNEAIEGYIDPVKNNLEIELVVDALYYSTATKVLKGFEVVRKATMQDHENLRNKSAWGYAVINNSANHLLGEK